MKKRKKNQIKSLIKEQKRIKEQEIIKEQGPTNPVEFNPNVGLTTDVENDGSQFTQFSGCTDEEAINYSPGATEDDGSCVYSLVNLDDYDIENDEGIVIIDDEEFEYNGSDYDFGTDYVFPGSFFLWKINQETGECQPTPAPVTDFYICKNSGQTGIEEDSEWIGEGFGFNLTTESANCLAPHTLTNPFENTLTNFIMFITNAEGQGNYNTYVSPQFSSIFFEPNGSDAFYLSNICPACLTDVAQNDYDLFGDGFPITAGNNYQYISPNNYGLTVSNPNGPGPNALQFENDGSCTVEACSYENWDNYFFNTYNYNNSNTLGDGPGGGLITVIDNGTCEWTGCTGILQDPNYICTINPALCPGTALSGIGPNLSFFNSQLDGLANNPTSTYGIPGGYDSSYFDSTNENYNDFFVSSIQDQIALNIPPEGQFTINTDDGLCAFNPIEGCTNPSMTNYDQNATIEDGSCYYAGCINPLLSYASYYICEQNESLCDENDVPITNYNDNFGTGLIYSNQNLIQSDNSCFVTLGCTLQVTAGESIYSNYNEAANVDDGTCQITACLDNTSPSYICNSHPELCVDVQEGVVGSGTPVTAYTGIQNETFDFNPEENFIVEDSSLCGEFGCTDGPSIDANWISTNWNTPQTMLNGQTYQEVYGDYPSTYAAPPNYNPAATAEDGSCNYDANDSGVADWNDIEGCMSAPNNNGVSTATNYNPDATYNPEGEDDPCNYIVYGCTDNGQFGQEWWTGTGTALEGTQASNIIYQEDETTLIPLTSLQDGVNYSNITGVPTYQNISADNFNPDANVDDGSCIYTFDLPGCLHEGAPGYEPWYTEDISILTLGVDNYNYDDNPCDYTLGCTDPEAQFPLPNIDAYTYDNGTCTYDVEGCTESSAINFNPDANIDDGSCEWFGCTQPLSANQSQLSFIEGFDLSSIYVGNGYNLGRFTNLNSIIGDTGQNIVGGTTFKDDGSCQFANMCPNPDANNYMCNDDVLNDLCTIENGNLVPNTTLGDFDILSNDACQIDVEVDTILGCKDPLAENYDVTADIDDAAIPGGTLCSYRFCGDDLFDNATPFNLGATYSNGTFHPGGGSATNKPTYVFDGVTYGGGFWNPDIDVADPTRCRFEGCAPSAEYPATTLIQLGMPETYAGTLIYGDTLPGDELEGVSGINGQVLYTLNSQNAGCQGDDGLLDPENISCCVIIGCTDDAANNTIEEATLSSDETGIGIPCDYSFGCTDSEADNFNPNAIVDDGTCFTEGCMDSSADNYNENATQDTYDVCQFVGCTDSNYFEYYLGAGTTALNSINDLPFNEETNSPVLLIPGQIANSLGDQEFDQLCLNEIIEGCNIEFTIINGQSIPYNNYNPQANINDGSCELRIPGCMDSGYLSPSINFNSLQFGDNDDPAFDNPYVNNGGLQSDNQVSAYQNTFEPPAGLSVGFGSHIHWDSESNPGACNFQLNVNYDDGSCVYPYTDLDGVNFDCQGNPQGTTEELLLGCTDPNACNYVGDDVVDDYTDDGTCLNVVNIEFNAGEIYGSAPFINSSEVSEFAWVNVGGQICPTPANNGSCFTQFAQNQSMQGLPEDCYVYACPDDNLQEVCPNIDDVVDFCFDIVIEQCDPCLPSGFPSTQVTLECVVVDGGAPIEGQAINHNATEVPGCTDPAADNFEECATVDEGCEYTPGCMDESALNYNPAASVDDGSCEYAVNCKYCPEVVDSFTGAQIFPGFWFPEGYPDDNTDLQMFFPTLTNMTPNNCHVKIRSIEGGMPPPYGTDSTDDYNSLLTQISLSNVFCMDEGFTGYPDPAVDFGEGVYTPEIAGCTYPSAANYNPDANIDDESCQFCCAQGYNGGNVVLPMHANNIDGCGAPFTTVAYGSYGCYGGQCQNMMSQVISYNGCPDSDGPSGYGSMPSIDDEESDNINEPNTDDDAGVVTFDPPEGSNKFQIDDAVSQGVQPNLYGIEQGEYYCEAVCSTQACLQAYINPGQELCEDECINALYPPYSNSAIEPEGTFVPGTDCS